jgi:predicted metal-dependent hydrolase
VEYPFVGKKREYEDGSLRSIDHGASWIRLKKPLEKYKICLGVKDVKLVVRPYKTRTAFTNLSNSPPTIYLNEYLIDDEEILEYLILREMIHIKLHMFRSRYAGGLSYAVTAFCTSSHQRRGSRRLEKRW